MQQGDLDMFFIKSFSANDLKNVRPVSVNLGKEKTHLVITGRNGSGKTSILKAIYDEFLQVKQTKGMITKYRESKRAALNEYDKNPSANLAASLNIYESYSFEKINIEYSNDPALILDEIAFIYFGAHRELQASVPTSITTQDILESNSNSTLNQTIVQYLVNQKAQQAFAGSEGDHESVERIKTWFDSFTDALRELFERDEIELKFDRKTFNFEILDGDKSFSFMSLSSGHSALLSIFSELLLRIERANINKSKVSGVILIDEPETHLHASLQKKILPLLASSFPQFQFIVATHSPFVISSLKNAKILNLENGSTLKDFSSFSYEAILEDYMLVDKYSESVKQKVRKIKKLLNDDQRTESQSLLNELLDQLESNGFDLSRSAELALELSSIKLALKGTE